MSGVGHFLWELGGGAIFAAHSLCLTNNPIIMTIFLAGDGIIAISYFIMGSTLVAKHVYTIRFSPAALTRYGAFIMLCGLSHVAKMGTLFVGLYWFEAWVIMATAAVSAVTAYYTVTEVYGAASETAHGEL